VRAPSTPSREPEALAKRYGVNPKTIAKWKSRKSVSDLRTGPKEPRSVLYFELTLALSTVHNSVSPVLTKFARKYGP
jgi:transposase-like protein